MSSQTHLETLPKVIIKMTTVLVEFLKLSLTGGPSSG